MTLGFIERIQSDLSYLNKNLMHIPPETRKKALIAFKGELELIVREIRSNLLSKPKESYYIEAKKMLHKLKGGAGFLGFEDLRLKLAALEQSLLSDDLDPENFIKELDFILIGVDKLS